jgi:hypothetical protein
LYALKFGKIPFSLKSEKGKKWPNGNPEERKKKKRQGASNILW